MTTDIDPMRHAQPLPEPLMRELLALADKLRASKHGGKLALVEAMAKKYAWTNQRVYAGLERVGYKPERKSRADAGSTRLPADTLAFIAASKQASVRANGRSTKPTCVAMNIADASGMPVNVSEGTVNRLLRERHLDARSQAQARNTSTLVSLYPNHVHQIDPSLCLLYYMGGKQRVMGEAEFYKNKLENLAKVKLKVWRYVRYDHASGTIDVRYYEAAGESQALVFEFLLYTWTQQLADDGTVLRLSHGVPKMLIWDKGSANMAHGVQNLLDALGVEHQTHAVHHAWAKGGVESANRLVETHFESRLRDEPVETCEALNEAAQRWARDYNANAMPHIDSRVVRASGMPMVRDDLWHLIRPEQLITMPERSVCAWFMTAKESTRKVNNLKISFAHPQYKAGGSLVYDLAPWAASIANGTTVRVKPLLMSDAGEYLIRLEVDRLGQDALVLQIAPEATAFDDYGRPLTGRIVVFGQDYHAAPLGLSGEARLQIAATTYGEGTTLDEAEAHKRNNVQPFANLSIKAHSQLGREALPERLPRQAQPLVTPEVLAVREMTAPALRPLNHTQAAIALRGLLGRSLSADEYGWLAAKFTGGVPPDQVEALAAQMMGDNADARTATGTHDAAPADGGLRRVK